VFARFKSFEEEKLHSDELQSKYENYTFNNNPQFNHVDDKLETVTEDEDSNNTDEYSGNHKVSSLPPG
jgi:hypothetical protein